MATRSSPVGGIFPRIVQSFILIPSTNSYYHGTRIFPLPQNIAELSLEGKKLFIEAMKSTQTKKFQVLTGAAKDAWLQERIGEGQKLVPPGHYIDKIFILIKITGIICVFLVASGQARL